MFAVFGGAMPCWGSGLPGEMKQRAASQHTFREMAPKRHACRITHNVGGKLLNSSAHREYTAQGAVSGLHSTAQVQQPNAPYLPCESRSFFGILPLSKA